MFTIDRHLVRSVIDTETLGIDSGSVITSIGIVVFNLDSTIYFEQLFPSLHESLELGLEINGNTLKWRLANTDLSAELLKGKPLREVLSTLTDIIEEYNIEEFWACSPSFDMTLIKALYQASSLPYPISYRAERDYRTIRSLIKVPDEVIKDAEQAHQNYHDSLDDALREAHILRWSLNYLSNY